MDIKKKIERLDKEEREWFREILPEVREGNIKKDDLLHFKTPLGAKAYTFWSNISIKSLIPLYDVVYYYFHPLCKDFQGVYKFSLEQLVALAEKKRAIPRLSGHLSYYPIEIIEPFIENNIPYISLYESELLIISYLKEKDMLLEDAKKVGTIMDIYDLNRIRCATYTSSNVC